MYFIRTRTEYKVNSGKDLPKIVFISSKGFLGYANRALLDQLQLEIEDIMGIYVKSWLE